MHYLTLVLAMLTASGDTDQAPQHPDLSWSQLAKAARVAHAVKDYDAAIAAYRAMLAQQPTDVGSRYNLACSLARSGKADEAVAELERAITAGFSDIAFIKADADLENISEHAAMPRLLAIARRVRAEQDARALLHLPGGRDPAGLPMLVFLHGHLDNPTSAIAGLIPVAEKLGVAVLVPAGGQAFKRPDGSLGFAWLGSDVSRVRVLARRVAALRGLDQGRMVVSGFSAGAALAYRLGLTYPATFAGVIAIGGRLPLGLLPGATDAPAATLPLVVLHGKTDQQVPVSAAEQSIAELVKAGFQASLRLYDGGHHFPADLPAVYGSALTWLAQHR